MAVPFPVVENHPDEAQVVGHGAVEAAAAVLAHGLRLAGPLGDLERAVLLAQVVLDPPPLHLGRQRVASAVHAERLEDMLLHVGAQRLTADLLHQAADPVDGDAVFPSLARIEHQRLVPRRRVVVLERRQPAHGIGVTLQVGVPERVGRPGRVGHQIAQRDLAGGLTQDRLTGVVEAVEHLEFGGVGKPGRDRRVEVELSLLDQLHGGGGGDRFGHGRHVEDAVDAYRLAAASARSPNAPE